MDIETIYIKLIPQDAKEATHATVIEFKEGMWTANGPMFPRIGGALHEIIQLLRGKRL